MFILFRRSRYGLLLVLYYGEERKKKRKKRAKERKKERIVILCDGKSPCVFFNFFFFIFLISRGLRFAVCGYGFAVFAVFCCFHIIPFGFGSVSLCIYPVYISTFTSIEPLSWRLF